MLGGGGWGGGVTYPKKMTSLFFKVKREKGKEQNSRPADIFGPSDCHAEQYRDQPGDKMQSILHFLQTFNLNSILKRSFKVEVLCMFISFPVGWAKFYFRCFLLISLILGIFLGNATVIVGCFLSGVFRSKMVFVSCNASAPPFPFEFGCSHPSTISVLL